VLAGAVAAGLIPRRRPQLTPALEVS
jgi:hypothetical protein